MDILLDNCLIDIKTVKGLELRRDYLDQLIGYYMLYLIGGVEKAPKKLTIEYIGIYFSRHGILYKIPVEEVIGTCDVPAFLKWFTKRAKKDYK